MKIIIALAIFGLIGLRSVAQDESADTENLKYKLYHIRLEEAAFEPYRKVDDVSYDLSPRIRWAYLVWTNGINEVVAEKPNPDWKFLVGKIFQFTHDGILFKKYDNSDARMNGDYTLVFIKHFPTKYNLVDDSAWSCYAFPVDPYSYTSTQGAIKTVAGYDYGTIPTSDEIAKLKLEDADRLNAEQGERDKQWQIAMQNKRDRIEEARQSQIQQEIFKKQKHEETNKKIFISYYSQATNGDCYAQFRLGGFYLHGEGVNTNMTLAKLWLSMAFTNGYTPASNLLNEIHEN